MLTLITPTYNRIQDFSRLEIFVKNQDYQGEIQWIVVCNGDLKRYTFSCGQTVIPRPPGEIWGKSCERVGSRLMHAVCLNYLTALEFVQGDKILCLEDDDIYFPQYFALMDRALDGADLAGFAPSIYLNFSSERYQVVRHPECCALSFTGFTRSVLPLFREIALRGDPFIDLQLWREWAGSRSVLLNHQGKQGDWLQPYCIGGKDGSGVGLGHQEFRGLADTTGDVFRRYLREYAHLYRF